VLSSVYVEVPGADNVLLPARTVRRHRLLARYSHLTRCLFTFAEFLKVTPKVTTSHLCYVNRR